MTSEETIALLALLAVVASVFGILQVRILWTILRTKTHRIAPLRGGLREVKGRVAESAGLVKSPWTRRTCVYYRFVLQEKSGKHHLTIVDEKKEKPFVLEDDTGRLRIEPAGAKLILSADHYDSSGWLSEPTSEMKRVLRHYDVKERALGLRRPLRYEETVLEPGDPVYVLGFADTSKKEAALGKKPGLPFIISDKGEAYLVLRYSVLSLLAVGVTVWAVFSILANA